MTTGNRQSADRWRRALRPASFAAGFWAIALGSAGADTLQPIGDEFDNPATLPRWQDIDLVEGWGASTYEAADIAVTTPGHFRIVPISLGWYNHLRGVLFFKEITGDFIITTRVRVFSRHNPANPLEVPNRSFSLTGIFVHAPRPFITQAAPLPYRTDAVWPPAAFGSDYVPNTENYIFLSFGSAGNPGTRQFEIKATRNSESRLYFASTGLSQAVNEAWLQMVRVGDTVVCLRKHAAAGPWIVENRYPNPDHPFPIFTQTLQVGVTAYTDWPTAQPYSDGGVQTSFHANYAPPAGGTPDLVSEIDYFRLQRPPPAVTEAALAAMATSYNPATNQTADPPVLLSASPAVAPYLGDVANVPLGTVGFESAGVTAMESDAEIVVTVTRSDAGSEHPLSVQFETAPGTATAADFPAAAGTLAWAANDTVARTIVVPLVIDGLAEGDESFTLVLSGLDGPATFPGSAASIAATLVVRDHPFDQWRLDRFGPGAANTPAAAPEADADNDGLPTLIEHVFGTDPLVAQGSASLPSAVSEAGRLGLRFVPATPTPGVRLIAQVSTSLGPWLSLASRAPGSTDWTTETAGSSVVTDPATGAITILPPAEAEPRLFLRLQAAVE